MSGYQDIYRKHADEYQRLIGREDHQGNLWRTIRPLLPSGALTIADMGAGTGRFARLLAPVARHTYCLDRSPHMLSVARRELWKAGLLNHNLLIAENSQVPLLGGQFDLALAGWNFGHITEWHPGGWQGQIQSAVDELLRIVRPGGRAMILETLGTGTREPAPPSEALGAYYGYLEQERGFSRIQIQTDYRFASMGEAEELTRFFFGDELGDRVRREGWVIVPEWTGLWWLEK